MWRRISGHLISVEANQIWIDSTRGSGFVRLRYEEPIAYSGPWSGKAKALPSARYGYRVWRKPFSVGNRPFRTRHDLSLNFPSFDILLLACSILLISNFRHVLNVVCFLLGNSPASEFLYSLFSHYAVPEWVKITCKCTRTYKTSVMLNRKLSSNFNVWINLLQVHSILWSM